jgi:hypothetical protein
LTRARRAAAAAVLVLASASAGTLRAQEPVEGVSVTVVDVGPGFAGRLLRAALLGRPFVVAPGVGRVDLARGRAYEGTLVVLGRDASVASRVRGDVIVVGGDLFVRPGAAIDGRAVAIGGTAARSELAVVRDGYLSFRDETFDVDTITSGYGLRYRPLRRPSEPFALPGLYGLRIPSYDRVNGLSVPVAPAFALDSGRFEIEPGVTYRSHLGAVDPSLSARAELGRRTRAELWAGRATLTNDAWIYSDIVNSSVALVTGRDQRNYFRADRGEVRGFRRFEGTTWEHEPFLGARLERAWSVGPDSLTDRSPWSLSGRTSLERMRRFNPPVDDGHIASALVGLRSRWEPADLRARLSVEAEVGFGAPGDREFTQITVDGKVGFPAFRNHHYQLEAHAVVTPGETAPRQRWAYVGGPGTLRTLDLLEQGGDMLVFVEQGYAVPLKRPRLPLVGPPTLTLRHVLGAAGVGGLPALEQELGLRLGIGFFRADFVANVRTGRSEGNFGFAFAH